MGKDLLACPPESVQGPATKKKHGKHREKQKWHCWISRQCLGPRETKTILQTVVNTKEQMPTSL